MSALDTQSLIVSTANNLGVPPSLALAVANQESRFDQSARSPAGAIGVFQLMPSTAAGLGVDPRDESQNILGGITYLKQMLDRFGDTALALAAYNAGPANVRKYGGVPPFSETQQYIQRITSDQPNWQESAIGDSPQNPTAGPPLGDGSGGLDLSRFFEASPDTGSQEAALSGGIVVAALVGGFALLLMFKN